MKPKRSRGQNFLVDQNMLKKIVAAADIAPTDTVVEIGAGTGNLTALLARKAQRVIAVEIDKDLMPLLVERFCHSVDLSTSLRSVRDDTEVRRVKCGNIEIIHDDARFFDPAKYGLVIQDMQRPRALPYLVVANIPYNITSLLIRCLLEADPPPTRMVLLVQKEVAERICAKPPHMSILSVAVQYYADARVLFSVPRTCFSPRPRVDSTLVSFRMKTGSGTDSLRETEPDPVFQRETPSAFFLLVHAGFAHKRKLLISNIMDVIPTLSMDLHRYLAGARNDKVSARGYILSVFQSLTIPQNARAQELSVAQWKGLAHALFPFPSS